MLAAIEDFQDPETGRSVVKMEQVSDIRVDNNELHVTLALTTFAAHLWSEVREEFKQRLSTALPQFNAIHVGEAIQERPAEKLGEFGLEVKSIVIVGSGKGGVGKSTIATALAFGLHRAGCKVGLMDADVYGPSIPHLVGVSGRPEIDQESKKIIPKLKDGLPIMSMGLLVAPEEAVAMEEMAETSSSFMLFEQRMEKLM